MKPLKQIHINSSDLNKIGLELPEGRYLLQVYPTGSNMNNQRAYLFGALIPIIQEAFHELGHLLSKNEIYIFLKENSRVLKREILVGDQLIDYTIGVNDLECNKEILTLFIQEVELYIIETLQKEIDNERNL